MLFQNLVISLVAIPSLTLAIYGAGRSTRDACIRKRQELQSPDAAFKETLRPPDKSKRQAVQNGGLCGPSAGGAACDLGLCCSESVRLLETLTVYSSGS
jgi:hypothetical protein